MELSIVGISHRTAAVGAREAFALPGELSARLLRALHAEDATDEALVLDTCNRTEVLLVWRTQRDFAGYLLGHVARLKGLPSPPDAGALCRLDGRLAVEHLFGVAGGLESQVVGEGQILGQLRAAYRLALRERTARFLLNRLLHHAFRVGKRVRAETALGRGAGTVAQAAAELVARVHTSLTGKAVLVVGAGQTAALAAQALVRQGATRVVVANRTIAAARRLAEELAGGRVGKGADIEAPAAPGCPAYARRHGAPADWPRAALASEAIALSDIPAVIASVDVVLCSTGSPRPVLTAGALAEPLGRRAGPIVIVDIAVPRDVEEAVGLLPGVRLLNMDDLDAVVAGALERRQAEVARAQAIVAEEVDRFELWRQARQVAPTIEALGRRLEAIVQAEVERYAGRFGAARRDELERFARSLVGKVLHAPTVFLNDLAVQGGGELEPAAGADLIRRMFALDDPERRP